MTAPDHSPGPWGYEYSPYTVQSEASPLGVGAEIPAYEIFDADGNKVFDTNDATRLLTTGAISTARPSSVTSWYLPGVRSRPRTVLLKGFS
jgi:hypothetical protein